MFQTTSVGVAVAVAETPSTVAVTVLGCQAFGLIHIHVLTPTSCSAFSGGAISITGEGRLSVLAACFATVAGVGNGPAGALGVPGFGVPFAGGPS
jgi:hypothetical protein